MRIIIYVASFVMWACIGFLWSWFKPFSLDHVSTEWVAIICAVVWAEFVHFMVTR